MSFEKVSYQTLKKEKENLDTKIGTLSNLSTTDKSSLVSAINELFTSASNGKTAIAQAITGKGITTSSSATFSEMAQNISNISAGSSSQSLVNSKCYVVTLNSAPTQNSWYYFNTADSEIAQHINDSTFIVAILNITDTSTSTYRTIGGVAANHQMNSYNANASYGVYFRINSSGVTGYAGVNKAITDTTSGSSQMIATSDGRLGIYSTQYYPWLAGTYVCVCGW